MNGKDNIFSPHFEDIQKALDTGNAKYGIDNWQDKEPSYFIDKIKRHLAKYESGISKDKESGLSHLAHVGANISMMDFIDRSKK